MQVVGNCPQCGGPIWGATWGPGYSQRPANQYSCECHLAKTPVAKCEGHPVYNRPAIPDGDSGWVNGTDSPPDMSIRLNDEGERLKAFVKASRMRQDCPFTAWTQESGVHTTDG